MSVLTFTLRTVPDQRLDLSALTPARLAGLTVKEIAALAVGTTRRPVSVGDAFAVAGTPGDTIRIRGSCGRLDNIGLGLEAGTIVVDGDAGAGLGLRQAGGRIRATGSAGPLVGAAMRGGVLEVDGDAGDLAGGAVAGEMQGMTGGVIVVRGHAGARLGDRMRRGLIAVGGDCGELAGSRMIAGSILVAGRPGARIGTLMRRGTILAGLAPRALPATFRDSGSHELTYLALYSRALDEAGIAVPWRTLPRRVRRLAGDMAALGKGEVLVAEG